MNIRTQRAPADLDELVRQLADRGFYIISVEQAERPHGLRQAPPGEKSKNQDCTHRVDHIRLPTWWTAEKCKAFQIRSL